MKIDLREVDELIEVSVEAGRDSSLVQAAGGNTSVKSRDGRILYVKASGTALAQMSRGRGWLALDRQTLSELKDDPSLGENPSLEQQETIAAGLQAARIDCSKEHPGLAELKLAGAEVRPSVESLLHSIVAGRVILHTHPAGLNGLLCSKGGARMAGAFAEVCEGEPMWVGYVEPGFTLAKRLEKLQREYAAKHGQEARFMFLGNHGLFVSADSARQALDDTRKILNHVPKIVELAKREGLAVPAGRDRAGEKLDKQQLDAFIKSLGAELARRDMPCGLVWQDSQRLKWVCRQPDAAEMLSRPSTPDCVVYCGRGPIVVGDLDKADPAKLLDEHAEKIGGAVRVVVLGHGYITVSASPAGSKQIAEVYESHLNIILNSLAFGGPKLLTISQAKYLDEGGAGKYRSSMVRAK